MVCFLKADCSKVLGPPLQEQFGMLFILQGTPNRNAIRKTGPGYTKPCPTLDIFEGVHHLFILLCLIPANLLNTSSWWFHTAYRRQWSRTHQVLFHHVISCELYAIHYYLLFRLHVGNGHRLGVLHQVYIRYRRNLKVATLKKLFLTYLATFLLTFFPKYSLAFFLTFFS